MAKTRSVNGHETEQELITKAQDAVSSCNWLVGQCAVKWTARYARGRTDADFASLIGLSPDQVYQRRRVWETFGEVYEQYASLKWSHFYTALNWDDAAECLAWAESNTATVAEMRAWRRVQHGEELAEAPETWDEHAAIQFVPHEPTAVRDPGEFSAGRRQTDGGGERGERESESRKELVAPVSREAGSQRGDYAPFRRDAGSPAPKEDSAQVMLAEKPQPSPAAILQRMTTTVGRLNRTLSRSLIAELRKLPEDRLQAFAKEVRELNATVSKLVDRA